MKRSHQPPQVAYSGQPSALAIYRMFEGNKGFDQVKLEQLVLRLESATDAAWSAATLLKALTEAQALRMPKSIKTRLTALAVKATADNKPDWVK